MTDGLFPPSSSEAEYNAGIEHRAIKAAEDCLATLNCEGECHTWHEMYPDEHLGRARSLLADLGWDASSQIRYRGRRSGDRIVREPARFLHAQTPARARQKLQEARKRLDAILTADIYHWRRRWRLHDWADFYCSHSNLNLDKKLVQDARVAFKKRDFAQANALFDKAFADREAELQALELKAAANKAA